MALPVTDVGTIFTRLLCYFLAQLSFFFFSFFFLSSFFPLCSKYNRPKYHFRVFKSWNYLSRIEKLGLYPINILHVFYPVLCTKNFHTRISWNWSDNERAKIRTRTSFINQNGGNQVHQPVHKALEQMHIEFDDTGPSSKCWPFVNDTYTYGTSLNLETILRVNVVPFFFI